MFHFSKEKPHRTWRQGLFTRSSYCRCFLFHGSVFHGAPGQVRQRSMAKPRMHSAAIAPTEITHHCGKNSRGGFSMKKSNPMNTHRQRHIEYKVLNHFFIVASFHLMMNVVMARRTASRTARLLLLSVEGFSRRILRTIERGIARVPMLKTIIITIRPASRIVAAVPSGRPYLRTKCPMANKKQMEVIYIAYNHFMTHSFL